MIKLYFKNFLQSCIFIMVLISILGCGYKNIKNNENGQETSNTGEQTETNFNPQTAIANPLIPRFEEQVIFDENELKLSVVFNENSGNPDASFHNLLYCKVKNNSKDPILLSSLFLETEDHLFMPLVNQLNEIPAETEDIVDIHFNPNISTFNKIGHDQLYTDYGLGTVLGNFRLHILIMHAQSYDHLMNITTEYIKTEKSEILPDYSEINKSPLLIDEGGIKVYWVDQFFLPVKENSYFNSEAYYVINFYENETDDNYLLNYEANMINDKEIESYRYVSQELQSNGKGFFFIYISKDELTEYGFDELTSLAFTADTMKLNKSDDTGTKAEENFKTDIINLDFLQPWKNIR